MMLGSLAGDSLSAFHPAFSRECSLNIAKGVFCLHAVCSLIYLPPVSDCRLYLVIGLNPQPGYFFLKKLLSGLIIGHLIV
jgi:hypothetical protein